MLKLPFRIKLLCLKHYDIDKILLFGLNVLHTNCHNSLLIEIIKL